MIRKFSIQPKEKASQIKNSPPRHKACPAVCVRAPLPAPDTHHTEKSKAVVFFFALAHAPFHHNLSPSLPCIQTLLVFLRSGHQPFGGIIITSQGRPRAGRRPTGRPTCRRPHRRPRRRGHGSRRPPHRPPRPRGSRRRRRGSRRRHRRGRRRRNARPRRLRGSRHPHHPHRRCHPPRRTGGSWTGRQSWRSRRSTSSPRPGAGAGPGRRRPPTGSRRPTDPTRRPAARGRRPTGRPRAAGAPQSWRRPCPPARPPRT